MHLQAHLAELAGEGLGTLGSHIEDHQLLLGGQPDPP